MRLVIVVLMIVLGVLFSGCSQATSSDGWVELFNGKDLDGWQVKIKGHKLGDNYGNTFRVEDGLLKVSYDQYEKFSGKFGHLFYEQEFSNYRILVEYRFLGDQTPGGPGWAFRNSGIMIHGQKPETMGLKQDFPVSIEVQLLGGDGTNDRTNGNLCTPGTHVVVDGKLIKNHCISSKSKTCHGDGWVRVEAEVRGSEMIRHFVDGQEVMNYQVPQLDPSDKDAKKLIIGDDLILSGGTISLQAESHSLEFRRVAIRSLD